MPAATSRTPGGALEKSAAEPALERVFELVRERDAASRQDGIEPAFAHGIEDPQAQIVDEPDLRQSVTLGQMIERKIDEVQVSENVDDAAAMAELAHTLHPGVVDLDVVEKAMIESRESGVRLVGLRQLALGHGFARERGETMILPRRRCFRFVAVAGIACASFSCKRSEDGLVSGRRPSGGLPDGGTAASSAKPATLPTCHRRPLPVGRLVVHRR